jgi:hypothetical protein
MLPWISEKRCDGNVLEFDQSHSEICSVQDTNIKGIAAEKFQKYGGKFFE